MNPLYLRFCFMYIRPGVGSKRQINKILTTYGCNNCDVIMGDLNLNQRHDSEKERIEQLCHGKLEVALNEATTTTTANQIDHILVNKTLRSRVFVSSFYNFVSNHKCIVIRIGIKENKLKDNIISQFEFASEKYMKKPAIADKIEEEILGTYNQNDSRKPTKEIKKTNNLPIENINLSCLEGDNWLTSDIINEYGNLLTKQFENSYVFSTHFIISLKNRGVENMRGWTKNVNIFEKIFLFFPIHENAHWYLIVVNNQEKTVEVLDPYAPYSNVPKSKIFKTVPEKSLNKIKEKIDSEHHIIVNTILRKYILKHQQCPSSMNYEVNIRHDIPKQKNDWDCGVFLLTFMKCIALNKPFNFETRHMPTFRQSIRREIERKKISEDTSTVEFEEIPDELEQSINEEQEQSFEEQQVEVIDDDTSPVNIPPRFENECGTICWLNAIVQLFLLTIEQIGHDSELKRIFQHYQNESRIQTNQVLRRLLSEKKPELRTGQQDSFDFLSALTDFPCNDKEWLLNPLTMFTKTTTTCDNNQNHQSNAYHNVPDFYLSVDIPRDNTSIQDVIENEFTAGQYINDWKCSVCKSIGGTKVKTLQDGLEPNYILVKIRRAGMDAFGRAKKNNSNVIPPLGFIIQTDNDNAIAYSLCGILTHIGQNLNSGHYISEVKKNNEWWKCNDYTITKTAFEDLSKQGYGFLFRRM